MKVHERWLAGFLALGLLMTACNGASEPSAAPTEVPAPTETATAVIEDDPTPEPPDTATDAELIAAAVAQLEADVAAEAIPSVFAYDVLDTTVSEDGDVTIGICAWTGDSVFDNVRDSLYRTSVDGDGTVTARHITTPVAAGECLNTQLIDSALAHINEYDAFWIELVEDPAGHLNDPRRSLVSLDYAEQSYANVDQWIDDEVQFLATRSPGKIQETNAADLLWRRIRLDEIQVLEIAVCRDMIPTRGAYRNDVLIDDGKPEAEIGDHSIDSFQLMPDSTAPGRWLISGRRALIWADCFGGTSWPESVNAWYPGAVSFDVLP